MTRGRNTESFLAGAGLTEEVSYCCSECGYTSGNRKHFKKDGGEGHTCSTGHYEDRDGNAKRARNPYASR